MNLYRSFIMYVLILCLAATTALGQGRSGSRPPRRRSGQGPSLPPRLPVIRPKSRLVVPAQLESKGAQEPVEIAIIPPKRPRFEDGAPIVVRVTPPLSAHPPVTHDVLGLTALGFAVVEFQYPRGESFDAGGPNCKRALADVLLFAMGKKADVQGQTIDQHVSLALRTDVVGVIGMSHGGNAAVTTLESFPQELSDLSFYVSYESPCATGPDSLGDMVTVDGGSITADPNPFQDADGNGYPWDDGRNPFYSVGEGIDYSSLTWDSEAMTLLRGAGREPTSGVMFLDGNGNRKVDTAKIRLEAQGSSSSGQQGRQAPGRVTTDLNRNGQIDSTEDFLLGCMPYAFNKSRVRVYSLAATLAAANGPFSRGFPRHVAPPQRARQFWSERDMAAGFDELTGTFSDLLVCIYSGREDHVQTQPDYPHIRAQYDGLLEAGIDFVKLNPDPVYVRKYFGATDKKLPANAPGTELTPENVAAKTMPVRRPAGHLLITAAIAEMADRVVAGERKAFLDAVLFPDAPEVSVTLPDAYWFSKLPESATGGTGSGSR